MNHTEKQIPNVRRASLSVEGAFAVPVFLFAFMLFLYFFVAEAVNLNIYRKGVEIARDLSTVAGVGNFGDRLEDLLSDTIADSNRLGIEGTEGRAETDKAANTGSLLSEKSDEIATLLLGTTQEKLFSAYMSAVAAGFGGLVTGLSCTGSGIVDNSRFVRISCEYTITPPIPMFGFFQINEHQDFKLRVFNGEGRELLDSHDDNDDDDANGEVVYVTETGTVYHITKECTHLKLSVHTAAYAEIGSKRNNNGGKYHPCEECARESAPATVYITNDGKRYHYSVSCSGLKRTIRAIPLEEAKQSYRLCSRCGG